MTDLTSNNDLTSEKAGHGDNALFDTGNTGKSINRVSYISAHVLLNLLNELGEKR